MSKIKLEQFTALALAAGVNIAKIIDALPKGATPNCYKPYQDTKEMARRRKQMKGESK